MKPHSFILISIFSLISSPNFINASCSNKSFATSASIILALTVANILMCEQHIDEYKEYAATIPKKIVLPKTIIRKNFRPIANDIQRSEVLKKIAEYKKTKKKEDMQWLQFNTEFSAKEYASLVAEYNDYYRENPREFERWYSQGYKDCKKNNKGTLIDAHNGIRQAYQKGIRDCSKRTATNNPKQQKQKK